MVDAAYEWRCQRRHDYTAITIREQVQILALHKRVGAMVKALKLSSGTNSSFCHTNITTRLYSRPVSRGARGV